MEVPSGGAHRGSRSVERVSRPVLLATLLGTLLSCGADTGHRTAVPNAAPSPPRASGGTIVRIAARSQVPLRGPRVDGQAGDWLLRHGDRVAVVAAATGQLVDFGQAGGRDGMTHVDSVAFDALTALTSQTEHIEPVGNGGHVLYVRRRLLERPLTLHVWYAFEGPVLVIESLLGSNSDEPLVAVTLGEEVVWGNVPTWVAGHGFVRESGTYGGDFIARDSHAVAYAMCSTHGRMLARFGSPVLDGYFRSPRTGEQVVALPARGQTPRRRVLLATSPGSLGHAAASLPCTKAVQRHRWPVEPPSADATVEVARCDASRRPRAPYAQFRPSAMSRGYRLPLGCFRARLLAPGHAPGRWFAPGEASADLAPTAGRLDYLVTERGQPLPAKLVVRGIGDTPDPDWGDDGAGCAQRNFAYTSGTGSLALPPGRYRVSIHHGPEYTAHDQEVEVIADAVSVVAARLERVVDTTGWLSADLHVHAVPSFDAPTLLGDRVRSLAAVHVEVAVATDHNAVTDYAPAIAALRLGERLASMVGDEVTTEGVLTGHFNVFPLLPGTPPLAWESIGPRALFRLARARSDRPVIIQVNHPRMASIGYFDLFRLDREAIDPWARRSPVVDMSFDALEVFSGDHYAEVDEVELVMRDWYALLNAGYRFVATGNSDSHRIAFHEAGVPRNWVLVGTDRPAALSESSFVQALRAGRVVVSSGPFLTLTANGRPIGATVSAGEIELGVQVQAPSWIGVDEVELWVRGERRHRWSVELGDGRTTFAGHHSLTMHGGDWVIAIARGTREMDHLYRSGATPLAFTNPIWVK